ncbi:ALS/FTD Associated gene homolog [Caenorhabditis elegans]|uniref:ALS/FTD Associated gene homolog n=1 Tax=Caenorhabditis elegans TaxID=6239 RepID=H2KYA3_CAEEL|nr:ALS/FTD Associated gene homolog [Caenorhabditis elegans]CCD62043.1 ALS/FTD Associated gene homolog [Caenorhabditis elegans]|eukprot:NP_495604.1 ALS/FTD Associated gene homolog [Caenorhabditis elegans]
MHSAAVKRLKFKQQKKDHAVRRLLPLKTSENCGIMKIVWSQFDFMTGPELKFVWDVTPSTSISPVNLSGEDGSIADAESLMDSSGSNQSVSFEEIDDPLKTELTILDGLDANLVDSFADFDLMNAGDYKYKTLKYLDEYMTESATTSTKTLTMDDSRIMESPESSGKSLRDEGLDHCCEGKFLEDERLGTSFTLASPSPNDTGHLGKLLASKYPNEEDRELAEYLRDKIASTSTPAPNVACVAHLTEHYELDRLSPINNDDELRRSCVDSGVGVSTHSDLSALCQSPPCKNHIKKYEDAFGMMTSTPNSNVFEFREERGHTKTPPPRDIFDFFDDQIDFGESYVTDEAFVAKCVLAELICNAPHSRCPLQHKMIVSPSRHLLVAAFIFSVQTKSGSTITYAISFLMSHLKQEWYLDRHSWFERMVGDSVPKMKASLFSEDSDDVLVRVTSELSRLLSLLSALERFPLVSLERPLMIKNTLFTDRGISISENRLLAKAISGCLQSQGHTVIIGSDHVLVARLLYTLAFFVPEAHQWCCLRAYRHKYNPYLKLQGVRRAELPSVIMSGTSSPWPICIIDIDRSAVCMSASYQKHRILRARNDSRGVRLILEHAGVMVSKNTKIPQIELSPCRTLESVNTFLKQMDLLPMEESVRSGFCTQIMLYFDNLAAAFIAFVRDASRPGNDEKECGTRSKSFSLTECRKSLDLTNDALFNAVLARAEILQPDISEFIYM